MAEQCFKLRRGGEYAQIPLTQQASATAVTEGTETLTETKKMGGRGCLIIYTYCVLIQCNACHHQLRPPFSRRETVWAQQTYKPTMPTFVRQAPHFNHLKQLIHNDFFVHKRTYELKTKTITLHG